MHRVQHLGNRPQVVSRVAGSLLACAALWISSACDGVPGTTHEDGGAVVPVDASPALQTDGAAPIPEVVDAGAGARGDARSADAGAIGALDASPGDAGALGGPDAAGFDASALGALDAAFEDADASERADAEVTTGPDPNAIGPELDDVCGGPSGLRAGSPWPTHGRCNSRPGLSAVDIPELVLGWRSDFWSLPDGTPAIAADGTVYVAADFLRAYEPDGTPLWVAHDAHAPGPPSIGADGTIYVQNAGDLIAIWPDGRRRWTFTPEIILSHSKGEFAPAIASDGTIYYVTEYDLYAVRSDGTLAWQMPIVTPRSAPLLGPDGTLYLCGKRTEAIRPDGVGRWAFDAFSTPLAHGVLSPDASTLYAMAGTHRVVAHDARTGARLWTSELLPSRTSAPLLLASDGSLVLSTDDEVVRLHPGDGRVLHRFWARAWRVITAPHGAIVTLEDGGLFRRRLDGTIVRSSPVGGVLLHGYSHDVAVAADGSWFFHNQDSDGSATLVALVPRPR